MLRYVHKVPQLIILQQIHHRYKHGTIEFNIFGGDELAVMEKTYALSPAILWNGIGDIVEMRKAKIKLRGTDNIIIETEMYKIKTTYLFCISPASAGKTLVTVETENEREEDKRSIQLMFATLDNMLGPLME